MIRKVSLILLILCMVVGLCACGKEEDTPQPPVEEEIVTDMIYLEDGRVLYRVTVVDDMAQPMRDVLVGFCRGEELAEDVQTGEDGAAEFISEQDNLTVRILAAPAGYAMMDDAFYFAENSSQMKLILPKA